jgi:hypothetical protein
MTNFDTILDSVLNETLPRWRQMRLNRKRREAQQAQVQERPKDLTDMLQEVDSLLPSAIRGEYHQYKEELMKNLGIIKRYLPSLSKDIEQVADSLFRGVGSQISSGYMESIGEPYQHLQQAYLGVIKQLENIYNIIPRDMKHNPVRQNIKTIVNYVRSTIGKSLLKRPTGD